MVETSGVGHEVDQKPRLVDIVKIAEAKNIPDANTILFFPPIMDSQPTQEALDQFSAGGNNVYYVDVPKEKYGKAKVSVYAADAKRAFEEKTGPLIPEKTFVIGYSSGCPPAGEFGILNNLPRGQVLLVAPVYPNRGRFRTMRLRGALQRARNITKKNLSTPSQGVDINYFLKVAPLIFRQNPRANYNNLHEFGTLTERQYDAGTIVTGGKDDMISSETPFTGLLVPEAGHGFPEFAPALTRYISEQRQK